MFIGSANSFKADINEEVSAKLRESIIWRCYVQGQWAVREQLTKTIKTVSVPVLLDSWTPPGTNDGSQHATGRLKSSLLIAGASTDGGLEWQSGLCTGFQTGGQGVPGLGDCGTIGHRVQQLNGLSQLIGLKGRRLLEIGPLFTFQLSTVKY